MLWETLNEGLSSHESAQDVIWNPGPTEEGIESEDYVYIEPECQAERAEPQDAKVPIGGLVSRRTASSMSAPTPTSAVPNSAAAGSTSGNIGRQQLSVSQAVAQSFGWSSRIKVLAFRLPKDLPKEHQATYVELSFRDYHLGRPDMLRLNQALVEQPVYLGQRLIIPNAVGSTAKCTVTQIWVRGRQRRSAVVTLETDLVYRSQSARVFLCLQISSEMNHFGVDGSLYSEKLLDHFLPTLFRKWHGTNHALSIVLFSRIIYEDHELPHLQAHQKDVLNKDHAGRACLDVYKTVVDMQAGFRWSDIESLLTQELRHFERRILLEYSQRSDGGLAGRMSEAHDGNVLEMLNLASRVFESSHIDRDLSRTCRSIILVTPGTCRFTVAKSLLRLTSERLVNGAASVDLVSLCKIPLHDVPVFAFKSVDPSAYYAKSGARSTSQQRRNVSKSRYHARLDTPDRPAESIPSSTSTMDLARSFQEMPGAMQAIMRSARRGRSQKAPPPRVYDPLYFDLSPEEAARSKSKWFYCIADWIDASFYSPQPDKPFRADRYMPRMVMQEVESLGVESDSAVISLPLLPRSKAGPGQGDAQERQLERDRMDDMTCGWHEPRKKRVSDNSKKSERFDLGNGLKPALPKMKRQDSTNTEATATASPRRGRPFYRAPSSSASATTTVASSTLALTPLKTKERSPSVSSRSSRRTPSVNVLSPTTTGSTASGQFTPVLMSRMNTKATPAPPTTGTKASTATGWLTGLLGGKSTLSKPQINLQRPDISIDSQAETSLRSASPARNEQKNSSTSVAPIAIGKPAPTSQTDDPMSLTLGTSVPSSIDSRLSLIPQKPKPIPSAATEASLTAFRVNPCNPTHNRGLPMHQIGRWGQPFDQHHVQWKSLCSPANLPLHLDWLPTAAELASHYDHGSYQIPIFPSSSSTFVYAQPTVEEQASHVLREMLFQRLGQGFQILRPSKGSIRSADRVSSSLAQPRQMRAMLQQADFSSGKSVCVYICKALVMIISCGF